MILGLTIPVYNSGHLLKQLDSIIPYTTHTIYLQVYLHNGRNQSLIKECEEAYNKYCSAVLYDYFPYGINRGNSLTHNDAIYNVYVKKECDLFISSSQDIYFNTPIAFDQWVNTISKYIDSKYAIGHIPAKQDNAPFSAFCVTRKGFSQFGYEDENLFPAQYDDLDIHRRMSLLNNENPNTNFWTPQYRIDIQADSTHECMSVRKDPHLLYQQTYITGPLNRDYYHKKWGQKEEYLYPFNNPEFGYYISYENRHKPYGIQYDRTDQDIVKV